MSYGLLVRGPDNSVMYDMGDYSTRFVTQIVMTLPAGQLTTSYPLNINKNDYFATIVKGNEGVISGLLMTELLAMADNGSVKLTAMMYPANYNRSVTVDVYAIR